MPAPLPVVLSAYDPRWPQLAAAHAERLKALGPLVEAIHHIGSTSVPGLTAKPIIDLLPVVSDLAELDARRSEVEALGYEWHGDYGIEGRRFCTCSDAAGGRLANVHFFAANSPGVARHLAFRDYLRAHPEAARAYEREKRRARALHPDNSHDYTDEKAAFVKAMESEALAWRERNRRERTEPLAE
jgi:GrpB-like predicted nucleotidyltransferase (UPF0157 family)